MTIVEATLWAIGSVVGLATLAQAAQRLVPNLQNDVAAFSLCQLLSYLALLVVLQTVYFPRTKLSVVFGLQRGRWVFYPIALLLGVAIHPPADGLYEAILARWPDDAGSSSDLLRAFSDLSLWRKVAAGVGLVVTTPLIEETFFRGALFGTLRRTHRVVPVIVATAMLFALVHIEPQRLLPIGIVGASLALLRAASGSLWPGVVMHATFNGVTFFAMTQTSVAEADEPIPRTWVVGGAIVSAGLLALCDHLRDRKPDDAGLEEDTL